jgi:exopolysaccharide biosynthesis polyprenyl glycosylphosphotransferase
MNKRAKRLEYVFSDFITAAIAWALFFLFRKVYIEYNPDKTLIQFLNIEFVLGIVFIPFFWLLIYYISGYYKYIYNKTISKEILVTLELSLIGVVILFFTLLLNDFVTNYKTYYVNGSVLFLLHFTLTIIPRIVLTEKSVSDIKSGKIYFNTLIIGCGKEACQIYQELQARIPVEGNKFLGYVKNPSAEEESLNDHLPDLGALENLPEIIKKHSIHQIIIAISPKDSAEISEINNWLGFSEISVKVIPSLHNLYKGKVKLTNLIDTPLIDITHELIPHWIQVIKRFLDFIVSLVAIIIFSPVFIFGILGIKLTSRGPVFIKQERVGKNGKPFKLYKFRSMHVDAEKSGPQLTIRNDHRLTKFGKILRKTKMDEIPNFINVLKGDMSIVGPRPERQFYIDQIVKVSPQYLQLQKIKPGITSLGQVKYGYAASVDEMVQRLRFDLLYMENISLALDFAIIYYTIVLLFRGRHI